MYGKLAIYGCILFLLACASKKATESKPISKAATTSFKDMIPQSHKPDAKVELASGKVSEMPKDCFSQEVYKANQVDCERDGQPVCGCNSITYQNACLAKKAGLTDFKKGKCAVEASGI